jgi:hypothetical protein
VFVNVLAYSLMMTGILTIHSWNNLEKETLKFFTETRSECFIVKLRMLLEMTTKNFRRINSIRRMDICIRSQG